MHVYIFFPFFYLEHISELNPPSRNLEKHSFSWKFQAFFRLNTRSKRYSKTKFQQLIIGQRTRGVSIFQSPKKDMYGSWKCFFLELLIFLTLDKTLVHFNKKVIDSMTLRKSVGLPYTCTYKSRAWPAHDILIARPPLEWHERNFVAIYSIYLR